MPTFYNVESVVQVDIDFEVYCNTCNAGLCNETTAKDGKYHTIYVNVCPNCMEEKEKEIEELKAEINSLEEQIYKLENQ